MVFISRERESGGTMSFPDQLDVEPSGNPKAEQLIMSEKSLIELDLIVYLAL